MNNRNLLVTAVLAALPLAQACAPDAKKPQDVMVLVYNYDKHVYEPRRVQLKTPTDLVAMAGPVANFIGGARFAINSDDPALTALPSDASTDAILNAIRKDKGSPVRVSYIESDGALVPADFHSLNIATTYYNLERAFEFFAGIGGITTDELAKALGTPTVYYFPTYELEHQTQKDNAAFVPYVQGFFILPFEQLQKVPAAINGGIVGHEYSHAIMNLRVYNREPIPVIPARWVNEDANAPTPALNLLKALDEGSADFFGTGITCTSDLETCEPVYFGDTLPENYTVARRVDGVHCMTTDLETNLASLNVDAFQSACYPYGCHYVLGSVFASALWKASTNSTLTTLAGTGGARKRVLQALWRAQGDSTLATPSWKDLLESAASEQDFGYKSGTKPSVLDAVVSAAGTDTALRTALCQAFMDRFRLTAADLRECRAIATNGGDCK